MGKDGGDLLRSRLKRRGFGNRGRSFHVLLGRRLLVDKRFGDSGGQLMFRLSGPG
jgi:hypothetical protein